MKKKSFTEQTLEEFKRETIQSAMRDIKYLSVERALEYAFDKGHMFGDWQARQREAQYYADREQKRLQENYAKKESWTVRMLEQTLVCHTVLQPNERGDFERLWKAKLDCEKNIGGVMLPRCRHGFLLNHYGCAECDKEDYEEAMHVHLSEDQ